jgi:hypothetical protein
MSLLLLPSFSCATSDSLVTDYSINLTGTFFLDNTSDQSYLCGASGSFPLVGETWNITIVVDLNSTSGVNVFYSTYYAIHQDYWEGVRQFTVLPNQSQTHMYISHVQIDTTAFPVFDIALTNSSGYARGSYIFEKVFSGYYLENLGTGMTYVSDITVWLDSLESAALDFSFFELFPVFLFLVLVGRIRFDSV